MIRNARNPFAFHQTCAPLHNGKTKVFVTDVFESSAKRQSKKKPLTQTLEALNAFIYLFIAYFGCHAVLQDQHLFDAQAAPCRLMDVLAPQPHHSLKKALL